VSKLITIPVDLLTRDWDKEAATKLSPFLLEKYRARTRLIREGWKQAQAVFEHRADKACFRRFSWWPNGAETAARFLEYQEGLWTVYMSLRVGADKPVKG
jgi:hypothetical protein